MAEQFNLPWSDDEISAAYAHMDRNVAGSDHASEADFREALTMLMRSFMATIPQEALVIMAAREES